MCLDCLPLLGPTNQPTDDVFCTSLLFPVKTLVSILGTRRGEKKGLQILLSYSQAGPGRKAKQGREEISRNHVQTFFGLCGKKLYISHILVWARFSKVQECLVPPRPHTILYFNLRFIRQSYRFNVQRNRDGLTAVN